MRKILCLYRATEFSPNMSDKDKAILDCVAGKLSAKGYEVTCVDEADIATISIKDFCLILSMARSEQALNVLSSVEIPVINTPESVRIASNRKSILVSDEPNKFPLWVKKANGYSMTKDDVVYVENQKELQETISKFAERGVNDLFYSSHIEGDLVKFYCVRGTDFFSWNYSASSFSKFGWEDRSSSPHHYLFSVEELRNKAETLAQKAGLEVFGGDCVVSDDGTLHIIDVNDWPSFSNCRIDAATAIVNIVETKLQTNGYDDKVKATYKSNDTEEWLDVVFTRKVGYRFAKFFEKLDIHPNTVTEISMVLGALAGWFFHYKADSYEGVALNIIGVLTLMIANFLDSADGQLARMTGKKTRLGRILDGAAGDVWFIAIYVGLCIRVLHQDIPSTHTEWGMWAFVIAVFSGLVCHARQCSLADYYRSIHLFFLSKKALSEFDTYSQQREENKKTNWKDDPVWKFFLFLYVDYTKGQETQTPQFQRLLSCVKSKYGETFPENFRRAFLLGSKPFMKWANILTFNTRAIVLYVFCLIDIPWMYWGFEIVVMTSFYLYMRFSHEAFCKQLRKDLENEQY